MELDNTLKIHQVLGVNGALSFEMNYWHSIIKTWNGSNSQLKKSTSFGLRLKFSSLFCICWCVIFVAWFWRF